MRLPRLESWPDNGARHLGHRHAAAPRWSPREFVQTVAGVAALGSTPGTGLLRPSWLLADSAVAPVPIPGGSPAIAELAGRLFHVYGPAPEGSEGADPPNSEPATITDFNG